MANSAVMATPQAGVYTDAPVRLFALASVLWGVVS